MAEGPKGSFVDTIRFGESYQNRNISTYEGGDLTDYDAYSQNCIFTEDEKGISGKKVLRIDRRPGLLSSIQDTNFDSIYGFYNWFGYSSAGQTVYWGYKTTTDKICVDGVTTYSHANVTNINYVSETLNSSGTTSLIWTRAADAWIYPKAGAVAQIATVPATMVGGFAHIDGWSFIAANTTGGSRIYNSTLNDPTAGYSDYVAVNIHPDPLVTVIKYKNFCLAFGSESVEWFQVTDNEFGSPLKRVPQYFSKVGLLPVNGTNGVPCIDSGNDTIYWISAGDDSGSPQVWTMEGTTPKKISTPSVEKILKQSFSTLCIKYFTLYGSKYLAIPIKDTTGGSTNNYAFIYSLDLNHWHLWYSTDTASINWGSINNLVVSSQVATILSSANKYAFFPEGASRTTTEFGTTLGNQVIVTSPYDGGTMRKKFCNRLRVLRSLEGGANDTLSIQYSDDDYVTWSTARTIKLSNPQDRLSNLGSFIKRAWKVTNSSTAFNRLEGLEMEMEVGDD